MTALPSFFPAVAAGVAGRAGDKSPQPYGASFFLLGRYCGREVKDVK